MRSSTNLPPREARVTARALARALARVARTQREAAEALEQLASSLEADAPEAAELIPHTAWPWSRRVSCRLARTGRIRARRSGKTWVATRADLDAYLATCPEGRREAEPEADDTPTVASILRAVRGAA